MKLGVGFSEVSTALFGAVLLREKEVLFNGNEKRFLRRGYFEADFLFIFLLRFGSQGNKISARKKLSELYLTSTLEMKLTQK